MVCSLLGLIFFHLVQFWIIHDVFIFWRTFGFIPVFDYYQKQLLEIFLFKILYNFFFSFLLNKYLAVARLGKVWQVHLCKKMWNSFPKRLNYFTHLPAMYKHPVAPHCNRCLVVSHCGISTFSNNIFLRVKCLSF